MPSQRPLLERHLPILRFDSRERYFPVSAAAWTDCPGHELRRADGTVLAATAGAAALELGFLGAERYADGVPVRPGDLIASPGRDYHTKAEAFHDDPRYGARVYGRARAGSDRRVWLQYRWFYFFNDYRLIGPRVPAGRHEGDWEMIQLRLDAAETEPDLALYMHHRAVAMRPWTAVRTLGGHPVVYVARGSHGSYFTPGLHLTGAWFDHADGRLDRGPQSLEVIDDGRAFDWIRWPGAWGGTRPRRGLRGRLDGRSPGGPGARSQLRWDDPAVLVARARR
ncbi:MAG: hypothetical protein ACRDQH_03865 [Pseudonocardiaceae bacterium]